MAALASPVINRHERAYSAAWRGSVGSVWSSWATPATPSMSTEMYTRMHAPRCGGFATMLGSSTNFNGRTHAERGPDADARRAGLHCGAAAGPGDAAVPTLHGVALWRPVRA